MIVLVIHLAVQHLEAQRDTVLEAANFIMFMHTPGRMASWFKTTGAFPADDRFNTKLISLPQQKVLFDLVTKGSPYLENFIPRSSTEKRCSASRSSARRKYRRDEGGRRDGEDREEDPAHAAEADCELRQVVGVVPLRDKDMSVSGAA